ncbi:hypothetical protein VQZ99_001849 [Salmonella enterica]|nr:hypothetical protein [Salmonella enterica]EMD3103421.1 hypothetical protein [Salmonella enterica]EMD3307831.1 hypothetical protein [Salmonella enterica]EMD3722842.1 hypothetical protein [Salmonella enterica]
MNDKKNQLTSRIHNTFDINGISPLADYSSVLDIVRKPRTQFIREHKPALGRKSEKIYDLAQGYVNQIRRLFRKNTLTQTIQKNTLSRGSHNIQGLMKNGPTWQNLFQDDWNNYCLSSAPEANDSPVSYLCWLYNQALSFETQMGDSNIISLASRRPDLPNLMLDDNAINQVIPSLQLVNEVLELAVKDYIEVLDPDSTVDETLAVTRYPTLLPYHYPHQQTLLSLEADSESLQDVIKKSDITWPWFVKEDLLQGNAEMAWQLGSNLAPEQQTIVTEADNSTVSDLSAFYELNFGINTADYSVFTDPDLLCTQMGITFGQLEGLVAGTVGGTTVVVSQNIPPENINSASYGAVFINEKNAPPVLLTHPADDPTTAGIISNSVTISNLSDRRMDKINRIVRLQRWLNLPYDQVDLLVTSVMGSNNSESDTNTLRTLSVFSHYQQNYAVNAYQFASVLNQITPYAIAPAVPFFDQIFVSPSLFEEPLSITNDPFDYTALTGNDGRIVKQICAGLGIDRAQFVLLAQQVSKAQGDGSTSLNCSLDVVSAFYRLVMVPRWLGLNFSDGMALLELVEAGQAMGKLAGIPVYAALDTQGQPTASDLLDTLMALADTATWLADNNLSALKILALLQSGEGNMPATTAELNFITEINQQLPAVLLNEQSFTGVPVPENTNILEFPAGYSSITGVVTNDAVQLNSKDGQYAMLDDEANTKVTGSNDYTLGGWAYIDSASEKTPLYATATIGADNTHTGAGISVTLGDGYNLVAIISDDTGKSITSSSTTGQANWGKNGAWFYFAVVMDTAAEILTLYAFTDSGTNVTSAILDYSSLTGSIGTPEGNTGSFNEDGSEQFYSTVSNMFLTVRYDNVCMWDSVLTESELTSIVQSGKPVLFSSWLDTFSDLIDDQGLVMPVAIDYSTVLSYVQADIAEYTFDDPDQVASMLATVIWQAKHSQDGIADSALAKALKTDSNLSTFLLAWADASEYSLLSQTLALSTITQAADIPDSYSQMLYQVARRAGICTTVGLTPAMMFTFLSNPAWFGVTDTSIDFNLMYLFSRYADWLKLTPKEDDVLAYLSWVNSDSLPPVTEASEALAALLNWDSDQVEQAAAHANETDGIARNLSQVDTVMRLQTLCTNTQTSVETVLNVSALTIASDYSAWQTVGESLIAIQA